MTDMFAPTSPQSAPPPKSQRSVAGWLLMAAATVFASCVFLAAAPGAWLLVQKYHNLRTLCCVIAMISGLSAAFMLAVAMYFLDRPTTNSFQPWHIRAMLAAAKRIILLLQLATTALALAAASVLIFDFGIPGT